MPFVNSLDNLADFFTKVIEGPQFFALRDKIMNVPAASACGPDSSPGLESRGGVERSAATRAPVTQDRGGATPT